MKTRDLATEMRQAFAALTFQDLAYLIGELGIPYFAIANWQLIGTTRITRNKDLFAPDPFGRAAFVTPALVKHPHTPESKDPELAVRCGALIDLVAWDPRHPTRWALRSGVATWLGSIGPQFMAPPAVQIWRCPLRWLQADCEGLVLLTNEPAENHRLLSNCIGGIVAENEIHAAEVRRRLSRPWPTPEVRHAVA